MEKIKSSVLKIIGNTTIESSQSDAVLYDKRYASCHDSVHEINRSDFDKVAFIDGGSAVLFDSSSFCIGKIRVVVCYFDDERKNVANKVFEAYILSSYKDEKTLCAQIDVIEDNIGVDISALEVSVHIDDAEYVSKNTTLLPNFLVDKVRRLAELHAAFFAGCFVCVDGSLRYQDPLEQAVISRLKAKGICGVCKTNSFLTKDHHVLFLDKKGYRKLASPKEEHVPDIYLAKLHPSSQYTFIVECFDDISSVVTILSLFSDDPRFFGYPYGLIKADRMARISNQERDRERVKVKMLFRDDWKKIERFVHTKDAHDILDRIS
jgi:hypothetical protein